MTLTITEQQNTPLLHTQTAQRMFVADPNTHTPLQSTQFAYAVGFINAKFPNLNLEKELYQNSLMGNNETQLPMLENINDDIALQRLNRNNQLYQTLFKGLSLAKNRYIASGMQWLLDNRYNEQMYTLLIPTDELLTQCITALGRTQNDEAAQVVVIGQVQPLNTILVQAIVPVSALPFGELSHGDNHGKEQFQNLVTEITSLDISAGDTDAARALNYTLYNNPTIYQQSYHLCYQSRRDGPNPNGYQLVNVNVETSQSGDRLVADVIFTYQGINTGAMQFWRSRVDVTGEYPFMVSSWEQYLPSDTN
ncbi:hypothetical protein [Pseudoalteromonas ardens]|uniref:PatG domain-containing protein n=1 Tax=Pseudoalteromonas rubra TaxID=43658 RepID=A0A0L0EU51_9GAMM|nr:hypothetical protein [Pseudoalteromonas sp. R96]KNC67941.1 hypothetical protein AC626_07920 [Pseudoalteromonas rubra]MDK1309771.1 hypothetical protein [Pseudoalteromonas sp. R96]